LSRANDSMNISQPLLLNS